MKTTHRIACFVVAAVSCTCWASSERLEDCVGATPDAVFVQDSYKDYQFTQKNKFKTVESGVTDAGLKIVLTSTRCTRNIREFSIDFPKDDHSVKEASYWLKQAADAIKALPMKPFFHRNANKVAAALKRQAKSRAPASVTAKGKKWKKPMDLVIQENYETVRVNVEQRDEKVVVTVTDDTAM